MTSIVQATAADFKLLAYIGKQTFIESHDHSAAKEDISSYVNKKYSAVFFREELRDANNFYHIIHCEGEPAGYSKIILNCPAPNIPLQNITKLERLYLLKDFYQLQLGKQLFQFNLDLSKSNHQAGIWLYVWKENRRAMNFYIKNGFTIIGSHDFQIAATHSNPNHQMLLKY